MSDEQRAEDDRFMQALTQSQRSLLGYIAGMTPTLNDAEDVLQEVNLALWKKRQRYDQRQDFLRWAFAFAGMEIRRFRGRAANQRIWPNDALIESLTDEYQKGLQVAELRRDALGECMSKLGPTESKFITGFYSKQASAQDLAAESGRPLSSVYKVLTRARNALRECVERNLARQSRSV